MEMGTQPRVEMKEKVELLRNDYWSVGVEMEGGSLLHLMAMVVEAT